MLASICCSLTSQPFDKVPASRSNNGLDRTRMCVARLERGEADVAAMEWWDGRPGFTARTWRREPLVVIVGFGHRWARRGSVPVTDLQTEPLLGGESGTGTGYLLRRQLGPIAKSLTIIDGFGSTEAVKRAVRAGCGASIRHGSLRCRRSCDRAACRSSYRRGRTRQGDHMRERARDRLRRWPVRGVAGMGRRIFRRPRAETSVVWSGAWMPAV